MASHEKSIRAESQEAGLWLWQGEAPPPRSPTAPSILGRIASAARWTGWRAPAGGLILVLLAASVVLCSTPPDEQLSADMRPIAAEPPSPLIVGHALISPPSIEFPDLRLDQLQMPPPASAQIVAQPTEGRMANRRAQRESAASIRKSSASARRGSPVLVPGVLTPPKDQAERQ